MKFSMAVRKSNRANQGKAPRNFSFSSASYLAKSEQYAHVTCVNININQINKQSFYHIDPVTSNRRVKGSGLQWKKTQTSSNPSHKAIARPNVSLVEGMGSNIASLIPDEVIASTPFRVSSHSFVEHQTPPNRYSGTFLYC